MTLQRLDNIAIVVDDLPAAIAFFEALGLTVEGSATVEGEWVDRLVGLDGVKTDITMMRTPDGQGRLELTRYQHPAATGPGARDTPPNALGMHRVMFAVEDLDDVLTRLRAHGAEIMGEVTQYEDRFRLCHIRGPEGIIIALAQQLR